MILLHLSDLHFGNKNRFSEDKPADLAKGFYKALLAAEAKNNILTSGKVDVVIVSGDLAESGARSQFADAKEFLTALAEELTLPRERFVFMPGNHDISWPSCLRVRGELGDELFPPEELESRLNTAKLANYRQFLATFYEAPVTDTELTGLEHSIPLGHGGWLRNFPELKLSVAALNTSEREHDKLKGGFLGREQAETLMKLWRDGDAKTYIKIIALHHNPVATTITNAAWTIDWLREKEKSAKTREPMTVDAFQHFIDDLIGFTGREHLLTVAKDTLAHLVLHGHHHDQGIPIVWPWVKNGGTPVLSVGSFGLNGDQLPGDAPLSCQLIKFTLPPETATPRLAAIPLVYDGRLRLEGSLLAGAFRPEIRSRAAYDQPISLPTEWLNNVKDSPDNQHQRASHTPSRDPTPKPPALYAEPPYIGSHSFVGRRSQLETLNEWASFADPHPIMLYEAIGGTGKSMLTWEWITRHTDKVRGDWAGRFWYSFYEKGATMTDFCRRALAYMTGEPRFRFREKNTGELTQLLLLQLRDRPWLLVLDGLERVLVSYHRYDSAQVQDEHAGLTDKMSERDPCDAINPEDGDLLRSLSAASPSKLLITSRLPPRSLLNRSGQSIPGVLRERLPGLRQADAELLIRSCGVSGMSQHIQDYLKTHCDCHPLVIGVLAGLITDYLPDKGNFDAWVAAPEGGGSLNLANLDLVQKRNHILSVALMALPEKGRHLLSTLALLSESVDYLTLAALNPSLSQLPEFVEQPRLSTKAKWAKLSPQEQQEKYNAALRRRTEYEKAMALREKEMHLAAPFLNETVRDLERRGLLQYDHVSKRYDLHPVVRGIAAGGMRHEEKNHYGQRVVDHFSQQAHNPYDQAEALEDFDNARLIVKALFQMGKKQAARSFINSNNFISVLNSRFEAHNEILSIVRPFFSDDWTDAPLVFGEKGGSSLATIAATCLRRIRAFNEAFAVSETALRTCCERGRWFSLSSQVLSLSSTAGEQNRLALEDRLLQLAIKVSKLTRFQQSSITKVPLARFRQLSKLGRFSEANDIWKEIMAKEITSTTRSVAAHHYALHLFFQECLTESDLQEAERLCEAGGALGIRNLVGLRGFWHLDTEDFEQAKRSLQHAVTLAHKAGKIDRRSEIRLAVAKAKLNELSDAEQIADQLSHNIEGHCYRAMAELWEAIGNHDEAVRMAESAFTWAWADGEPYSHFHEAKKARALLKRLGIDTPAMRAVDVESSKPLQVEEIARDAIEELGHLESMSPDDINNLNLRSHWTEWPTS